MDMALHDMRIDHMA